MSLIYFYKLTSDNGGAPCVQDRLLSLAICKPKIRMNAKPGDLIFGFAANSLYSDNRLIYIAHISEKACDGTYYRDAKFTKRPDCIYRWQSGRFERREDAKYHGKEGDLTHDLGTYPAYPKAAALLSNDFRYFGGDGSAKYKSEYQRLKAAIEGLGRGERVNLSEELSAELRKLKQQVWRETHRKTMGKQSSDPGAGVCHRTRSCGVIDLPYSAFCGFPPLSGRQHG
jgi:Nucleotide modification associated domain 2